MLYPTSPASTRPNSPDRRFRRRLQRLEGKADLEVEPVLEAREFLLRRFDSAVKRRPGSRASLLEGNPSRTSGSTCPAMQHRVC
ncbi:MAG: hypothetical protein ACM357_07420 [Gemmatimonadota bacterium]